ncbi:ROK family protein [Arthrobacter sp. LAPM80]|uniref:ROK family protein n=1 Tax=Arthrobacter sp. LAPM80 TaxID=3141788 RepID=UPI00398A6018
MELTANTPQQLRHTNMSAILGVMRRSAAVTGTDLIEATGLARATVIAVCDDLIRAGWVHELPAQRPVSGPQKGRPARVFEFAAMAGVVVGLDIGVAKTTALVTNLRGEILAKSTRAFGESGAAARLASIDTAVDAVLADAGVRAQDVLVAAVGIAAPVDRKGRISHSQPFWANLDIGVQENLRDRHGWPVLLANDANLAALAERWMGVHAGAQDLAVMLAGDRIGFGLIESGRLLRGVGGRAGEVGHLELVKGVGTPEGIAVLARDMAQELLESRSAKTLMSTMVAEAGEAVGAEMVFAAAAAGDTAARGILDVIAVRMARIISLVGTLFDPDVVVIGGAVASSAGGLLGPLEAELARLMPNPPRVEVSTLGDAIVTLGAVRLALDHVELNALDLVLGE